MSQAVDPSAIKAHIATLREHLDIEVAQFDEQGRYVLEPEAMLEIVNAIDALEVSLASDEAEGRE